MRYIPAGGIFFISWVFCAGLLAGCMQRLYDVTTTSTPVRVGDTTVVNIVTYQAEAPGLTYLTIHDNEDTATEAVHAVIRRHGGRLLDVQHTGDRNIVFSLGGAPYVFDPNRIFTDDGARASLDTLGAYSDAAHQAVRAFADTLLQMLPVPGSPIVVTVHNNTEGEYSTLSYMDEGLYQRDALFAHLTNTHDIDNFFFVTDQELYDQIRSAGFNVVLQNNAEVTDDGSLSVYVSRLGIPYINVEAQHGHVKQQVEMLDFLNDLLARPVE